MSLRLLPGLPALRSGDPDDVIVSNYRHLPLFCFVTDYMISRTFCTMLPGQHNRLR